MMIITLSLSLDTIEILDVLMFFFFFFGCYIPPEYFKDCQDHFSVAASFVWLFELSFLDLLIESGEFSLEWYEKSV